MKKKYSHVRSVNNYVDFLEGTSVASNVNRETLGFLNTKLGNEIDFEATINGLLKKNYSHSDFLTVVQPIAYDISLAYFLRNFGGHNIREQRVICQQFENIIHSILNTLFFIIEKKF